MVKNTPLSSRSKSYNNGTRYASIYISHNGSQLIIVWWLKKNISLKYVCFMRARIMLHEGKDHIRVAAWAYSGPGTW